MTALQQIKTIDKVRSNFILYRGKNKGPDYSKEGKELILKKLKNEFELKSYKPNFCLLIVSRGCHYQCKMCNYWKEDRKSAPSLTYDEIINTIDELKRITQEDIVVHLIGGDPCFFLNLLK